MDSGNRTVPRWLEVVASWSWRILLVAGVVWVVAWLARYLSVVLVPMIVALFVAAVLAPPMDWLRERGLPNLAAIWVVILGALAVLAGIALMLAPVVAGEVSELSGELTNATDQIKGWLTNGPLDLEAAQVDRWIDAATGQFQQRFLNSGGAMRAIEVVGGIFFGLIVAFFLAKDREHITRWFVDLFWADDRDKAERAIDRGWGTLRSYMGGTAIIGVVDAVLIGIGLIVLGVPLAVPLMIFTFVGAFIPLIGAFVAGLLAALVALAANGVVDALIVTGIVVVVQQVEGDVLAPAVLGRAMKLHPLVILVGVFAGAVVAGVFGAFITVPAIATVLAVKNELDREPEPVAEPVAA